MLKDMSFDYQESYTTILQKSTCNWCFMASHSILYSYGRIRI